MVPIVDRDNPVLRKIAAPVPLSDIGSSKIQSVIAHMKEAMASQEDGVAIAAPQINESLRIFVVSGKVLAREKGRGKKAADKKESADSTGKEKEGEDTVYVNPVITKLSKDKKPLPEGCLSVRYFYGNVMRSTKATVEAYNEKGEKVVRGASGLLAQIFQHEVDHLDGILFIDKATDLEDAPPENIEESEKAQKKSTKSAQK